MKEQIVLLLPTGSLLPEFLCYMKAWKKWHLSWTQEVVQYSTGVPGEVEADAEVRGTRISEGEELGKQHF